jgi:hypothetical protein
VAARARSPSTFRCKPPVKYELAINLKTEGARTRRAADVLARADEVRRLAFISLLGGCGGRVANPG